MQNVGKRGTPRGAEPEHQGPGSEPGDERTRGALGAPRAGTPRRTLASLRRGLVACVRLVGARCRTIVGGNAQARIAVEHRLPARARLSPFRPHYATRFAPAVPKRRSPRSR